MKAGGGQVSQRMAARVGGEVVMVIGEARTGAGSNGGLPRKRAETDFGGKGFGSKDFGGNGIPWDGPGEVAGRDGLGVEFIDREERVNDREVVMSREWTKTEFLGETEE